MKITRAIVPLAVAALFLAGCSANDDTKKPNADSKTGDAAACLESGAVSEQVEVAGDFGAELTLETETPLSVESMERSVLIEGEGDAPADGQGVYAAINFFSGEDGSLIQHVDADVVPNSKEQLTAWAFEAIHCAAVGQRVALVLPATDAFQGQQSQLGLAEDDAVVAVLDITKYAAIPLERAEGKQLPAPEGFPTVELDDDGSPTITIPEGLEAPTSLQIATLIEGEGETVESGDDVVVNYRGIIWRTGEEFDASWSRGEPANFNTDGVIGGFSEALVGQKVGSQVISVVPAEDGGYGGDRLVEMGHEKDDVMVFVLDILSTEHAD